MKKSNVIRTIDNETAQVTKAFQKNAVIFGTEEFKLWREYLTYFPNAKMTTKSINKNPNQKNRRNLTFKNMVGFIQTQPNAKKLMEEYETIQKRSKVQASPYQYVLSWFEGKFEGYNDLKQFLNEKEEQRSAEDAASETEND